VLLSALRLLKILAVASLFAGTIGAFLPRELEDRRRAALWLAAPGLLTAYGAGFALASVASHSLLSSWILASLVLSLFSLQVVLFAVAKEGRRTSVIFGLAIVPLLVTAALMVFRP
jgi:hypothetical protein